MAWDVVAGYRDCLYPQHCCCGTSAGSVLLYTTGLRGTTGGKWPWIGLVSSVRVRWGKWVVPHLTQETFTSPVPWALLTEPWEDSSRVSCSLSLSFLLCFQGERGMPGLPGRHGTKVPCKQWSDACLPDLTRTARLSLMHKHHLDLCVCLLVNDYLQLNSFCFYIAKYRA